MFILDFTSIWKSRVGLCKKTWINYFFSRIFGLDDGINLIPDGDNELVTIHNVEVNSISISTDIFNLISNYYPKICNKHEKD